MKFRLYIIFLLKLIFILDFNNNLLAKITDKYYTSSKISSYFNGILSFQENNFTSAFKNFNELKGLENYHGNFSKYYQNTLVNLEKFDKAYDFSRNLEKNGQDNFQSNLLIAVYELKNNNIKEASKYFRKYDKYFTGESITGFLSSSLNNWISFNNLSFEQAKQRINNLDERFKKIKKIQYAFVHCFYNKDDTDKIYEELISNDEDLSRYSFFHANYLYRSGNVKKSNLILSERLKKNPESLILNQFQRDIKFKKTKNFSDNFNCRNINHIFAEIFYIVSNALSAQGLNTVSNFYLNLAKFLNKDLTSYDILYAENLYDLNNLGQAKKVFRKISNKGKIYEWYAAKQITNIMLSEKLTENAILFLEKKFKKIDNPNIFQIYDYADFLKRNEKYEKSLKYFNIIMEKIDENHTLYSKALDKRGVVNERLDNWESAEKDFLNSLRVSPDQAYVINYLAYSWIEKGKNIKQSLKMLQKANDLKRNDGYIIDSLGWAHFKLKNYQEAKLYLQKAVKIMPSDPIVNDHYGDSLWMTDKKIQARYYWKNVLRLEDIEENLKNEIEKKLTYGLTIK